MVRRDKEEMCFEGLLREIQQADEDICELFRFLQKAATFVRCIIFGFPSAKIQLLKHTPSTSAKIMEEAARRWLGKKALHPLALLVLCWFYVGRRFWVSRSEKYTGCA